MKRIFIFLFFFASVAVQAQDNESVLVLKDGSAIRGTLLEYAADSHVRFKTLEGEIREYKMEDVARLTDQMPRISNNELSGFTSQSSIGTLLASAPRNGSIATLSFRTVNGWRFKNRLQVGVGTGVDFINSNMSVPVLADVQYNFMDGSVTPFVGVYGGYMFSLDRNDGYIDPWWGYYDRTYAGGPAIGGNVGITNFTREHFGIQFTAGYMFSTAEETYTQEFWNGNNWIYYPVTEKVQVQRIRLAVGIIFN